MKSYKPYTDSRRHMTTVTFKGKVTTNEPHKALTKGGKRDFGRNNAGRITVRHKGGGVTHGPRNDKIYAQKINRTMSAKALLTVLSRKYKDGEVIFVDSIEMQAPKASAGKAVLAALGKNFSGFTKKKNAALIALPSRNVATIKSFSNFGNISVEEARNLNPLSVLSAKYLVIASPKDVVEMLGKKSAIKSTDAAQDK